MTRLRGTLSLCIEAFPAWTRPLALAFVVYALSFGMRMLEYPAWQNPEYMLDGEYLLATHDAYHWIAGAEGFEFGAGHPMSELVRLAAAFTGTTPAAVGFWLPPVMASLVAVGVFGWAAALGGVEAGVCAGVLASLAPGFLARTLLGYCDTDLVTLLFPLLMGLGPAFWMARFMFTPLQVARRLLARRTGTSDVVPDAVAVMMTSRGEADDDWHGGALSPRWLALLAGSGLVGSWGAEWHSLFPYLIRYDVVLLFGCICVFGRPGMRRALLVGGLAYALPMLVGAWGLLFALALGWGLHRDEARFMDLVRGRALPIAGWCAVAVLLFDPDVFRMFLNSIAGYVKRSGDPSPGAGGDDPLVYPSVAQSIIEVQDLSLSEVLSYFHPWLWVALAGLGGFVPLLLARPAAFFLLPLGVLSFLSVKLGGRMVMFGAPVLALGFALPMVWGVQRVLRHDLRTGWVRLALSAVLLVIVATPFVDLLPAMTQGPIINKRHAEALRHIRTATPEDSMVWIWWDWGYSAHHFAHRRTIADGASHGGPSLYVPAAVFSTANPRFAWQLIRYTAERGGIPGSVFEGMGGAQAQELVHRLGIEKMTFADAPRQYLVVSYDMLRLGFWITNFGTWDFLSREGKGYAISSIPQQLSYSLDTGEVQVQGNTTGVLASTIDVFDEGQLERRDYIVRQGGSGNAIADYAARQRNIESRRNIHFLFNKVTGEKLVLDDRLYNTVMVQLLLCSPDDTRFAPYFKLIYDNVYARVYEVR